MQRMPIETMSDETLLEGISYGNENALAQLYQRYGGLAYSLAVRIVGDLHGAEDVVQESFLNVWRMANTFNLRRGSAKTWLLSVVHHKAVDACRRRRGRPPDKPNPDLVPPPLEAEDVWTEVANSLDREVQTAALSQIPAEQREAIEMAYFGGYSHREISELKQVPLGTVKGRLRIGMEKLRGLLTSPIGGRSVE